MTYLIDINVLSEIRKGARANAGVRAWYAGADDAALFLSTLVLGEIRKGAEKCRAREPEKARFLLSWLDRVTDGFHARLLGVDRDVALVWGRISAARTIPVIDGLLAATAIVHDLTLVTRNVKDAKGTGAKILNPFSGS